MESDATPQEALVEAERATATLWTRYPSTPSWYYPAGGAWCAGLVLALGGLHDSLPLLVVAVAGLLALSAWYRRWYIGYRGALPRVGSAPAELRPAIGAFVAVSVVVLAAIVLLYVGVGYLAAALLAFVGVTSGLYVYERAYETAAAATGERLG